MAVLGIDQSLRATGIFWIDGDQVGWKQIDTGGLRGAPRLVFIKDAVAAVVDAVRPTLIAMEGYSYGSAGKSFELGEIGGVLKVAIQERSIPLVTASPVQVKKFITGRHMADKIEVVHAVNTRFGLKWGMPENNLADAAALASIAKACLEPNSLVLRHEAEVVAAIQKSVIKKTTKRRRPVRRRLVSI